MTQVPTTAGGELVVKGFELPRGVVLTPGLNFNAFVKGGGEERLFVLLRGKELPLPPNAALARGQQVDVKVVRTEPELVFHVSPRAQPSATPALPSQLVPQLLESLGGKAPVAAAASQLVLLFADSEGAGAQVTSVMTILSDAKAAGVPLAPQTLELLKLLTELAAFEPGDLPRLLKQLAEDASRSSEARVAKAIRSGDYQELIQSLDQSLKAQLASLGRDDALLRFAERQHSTGALDKAIGTLVARLMGGELQNLTGIDTPYLFFEVPFKDDAPIRRAFIHVFGRGQSRDGPEDSESMSVALDLSTSSLGDIWVSLRTHEGRCACEFRAERAGTDRLIEASRELLLSGLKAAGYREPLVATAPWREGRLAETSLWLRPVEGVDERV